jgi:SAM-dependent methyltransferase
MDPEYGRRYRDLFERHWWWRARAALVLDALHRLAPVGGWPAILDVGCGDGLLFDELAVFGAVEGVEPDSALVSDAARAQHRVHVQPFDQAFQPGRHYDLILFLDVLEHLAEPLAALRHALSLLAPGGLIFITVPAFRSLWTAHDEWNHHVTRYTAGELAHQLTLAGLTVRDKYYFFSWLAPLKLGVRVIESIKRGRPALPRIPPAPVNRLLYAMARMEARLLTPLHLPFGSSLCAIATASTAVGSASGLPAPRIPE